MRGYREVNGTYRGDRDGDGYYVETAHRIGYQDGFNDGLRDRRSGHSFRPTHDDHYEDANRGYDGRFGNKSYYKQLYREAYRSGYEQGYGNGWRPY